MRRKNDQLWKGILEEVFDDLLRFFFPEAEPDTKSSTRFVDKLVRVYRQDGREE